MNTDTTRPWTGRWDEIGTQEERIAYLETYWPLLLSALRLNDFAALRKAVEALHTEAATRIGSLHYRVEVVAKADVLHLIDAGLENIDR